MTWRKRLAAVWARFDGRPFLVGIVAALLFNSYGDVSLKGPLGIGLHFEGWKPKAERLQRTIDEFGNAQEEARKRAEQELAAKEREYREKAGKADDEHTIHLADFGTAADRYVAANRVREGNSCPTGSAGPTGEGDGAGVPAGMPADPLVAVRANDVQACSALYAYALSAHDWAANLSAPPK